MSEIPAEYNAGRGKTGVCGAEGRVEPGGPLSPQEEALIRYCRALEFGRVIVQVERGAPIRIIAAQKSIKL